MVSKRLFWLSLPAKAHKGLVTVDKKRNKTKQKQFVVPWLGYVIRAFFLNIKETPNFQCYSRWQKFFFRFWGIVSFLPSPKKKDHNKDRSETVTAKDHIPKFFSLLLILECSSCWIKWFSIGSVFNCQIRDVICQCLLHRMIVIGGGSNLLTRKKVDGVGHALVIKGFEIVNFLTTCFSKFTLLKSFQNVRASLRKALKKQNKNRLIITI